MTFRAAGSAWSTAVAIIGELVPLVTTCTPARKPGSRSRSQVRSTSALRRRPHVDQPGRPRTVSQWG
jgi:hypothetical protein